MNHPRRPPPPYQHRHRSLTHIATDHSHTSPLITHTHRRPTTHSRSRQIQPGPERVRGCHEQRTCFCPFAHLVPGRAPVLASLFKPSMRSSHPILVPHPAITMLADGLPTPPPALGLQAAPRPGTTHTQNPPTTQLSASPEDHPWVQIWSATASSKASSSECCTISPVQSL